MECIDKGQWLWMCFLSSSFSDHPLLDALLTAEAVESMKHLAPLKIS